VEEENGRLSVSLSLDGDEGAEKISVSYSRRPEGVCGSCGRCSASWVLLADACQHLHGGAFLYLVKIEESLSRKSPEPPPQTSSTFRDYAPSRPSGLFLVRFSSDWGFLIRTGLRSALSHRSYLDWTNRLRHPAAHRLPEYPIWKAIHEGFFLEDIREWSGERYPVFFPKNGSPFTGLIESGRLSLYRPGETHPLRLSAAVDNWRYVGRWSSSDEGFLFQGEWCLGEETVNGWQTQWLERKHCRLLEAPSCLYVLPGNPSLPPSLKGLLEINPHTPLPLPATAEKLAISLELRGHPRLAFQWGHGSLEEAFGIREDWKPQMDVQPLEGQSIRIFPYVRIGEVRVPLFGPDRIAQPDFQMVSESGKTLLLKRDRQSELLLRNVVEKAVRKSSTTAWIYLSEEESRGFWRSSWPEIEKAGFCRSTDEAHSGILLPGPINCHVRLESGEGPELLAQGYLEAGDRIFPLPALREEGEDPLVKLSENDSILFDRVASEQAEMLRLLFQLDSDGKSWITPHAAGMILLHRPDVDVRVEEEVRKQIRPFLDPSPSTLREEDAGPSFAGVLRTYQKQGVGWLLSLLEKGLPGVLADEMGLGKTVTVLAFLSRALPAIGPGPVLVVVPASLVYNWEKEVRQFVPELSCQIYHGSQRQATAGDFSGTQLWITTYGTVRNDIDRLSERSFSMVILDEAQNIKNPESGTSVAVSRLKGGFRLLMTGTPVENHLLDLWSLFRFLFPGLLGTRRFFEERYVQGKGGSLWQKERIHWLKSLVGPLILRRTKKDVLSDLPEKTLVDHWVDPGEDERTAYRMILQKGKEELRVFSGDRKVFRMNMLALLLKLRLFCCHPDLVLGKGQIQIPSPAKFLEMLEKTREALEDGHRVLIFSQFTGMLDILGDALEREGVGFYRLDGQTTPRERQRLVDRFQEENPSGPSVFLASLKAGGVGLTLTNADFVFHYDPWWNPQVENQATDRAHRIGQKRPVFVYRFLTRGTVEEKVKALKDEKLLLFDMVMGEVDPASEDGFSRQLENILEWIP